jgi:hypothetical protein
MPSMTADDGDAERWQEEDFQPFIALLDADRFEGRYRDAVHSIDSKGLMRRVR